MSQALSAPHFFQFTPFGLIDSCSKSLALVLKVMELHLLIYIAICLVIQVKC